MASVQQLSQLLSVSSDKKANQPRHAYQFQALRFVVWAEAFIIWLGNDDPA